MANSLGTRPITIDTPGATVLFTTWLKIENIIFTDYAADTDTFVIQDQNGHEVWSGNGKADLSPVISYKIDWVNGLKVPTLSSGKLIFAIR